MSASLLLFYSKTRCPGCTRRCHRNLRLRDGFIALLWGSARLGRLGHGVCLEYDRIPYSIGEMAIAQMFRNTVPVYTLLSYGLCQSQYCIQGRFIVRSLLLGTRRRWPTGFALVCLGKGSAACSKGRMLCAHISLSLLRPSSPHRMSITPFFLLFLAWPFLAVSAQPPSRHKRNNVPPLGFYDPRSGGGSWLTVRLPLRCSFSVPVMRSRS